MSLEVGIVMRTFAIISSFALLPSVVFGQSSETPATFEIADVHVSAHTSGRPYMRGRLLRGDRCELRTATMVDLIARAYGIDDDKVVGGPSWLEMDRFDVIAKTPPSTTPETARLMLQALLVDRFKLVIHQDTKPLPAYSLTVGKGKPKLKEAGGSGDTGCNSGPQNPQPGMAPYVTVACRNMTMQGFARNLRYMANAYLSDPVIDSTGLKGTWDFDLKWTGRNRLAQAGSDGITIFDALDKELGLKLELEKIPSPVIVVDSVNEKPTDNSPEAAKRLIHLAPTEFEVADVKPSAPDAKTMGGVFPGGRVTFQGFALKGLIRIAWDIDNDNRLVGAPKWLDSTKFDVIAKASTSGPAPQVDFEDARVMLRALLAERFKLATHNEDRELPAYTLVAAKPKLTKADPANRTRCKEGPAPEAKDPRNANPVLSRLVTCQNITMAQFADQLQGIAPGYLPTPVLDGTGIDGAWDFSLNFSAVEVLRESGAEGGPGRGGESSQPASLAPTASAPSGAVSLFDAIYKQLGLKLEMHKSPMQVLVIDHVEEKPTEN
jgi:uncharacterized protein (TIGR03435 family)